MSIPKNGSTWVSGDYKAFVVLHTIELEGHTWVHYRAYDSDREYSCYVESFIARFTETPTN